MLLKQLPSCLDVALLGVRLLGYLSVVTMYLINAVFYRKFKQG